MNAREGEASVTIQSTLIAAEKVSRRTSLRTVPELIYASGAGRFAFKESDLRSDLANNELQISIGSELGAILTCGSTGNKCSNPLVENNRISRMKRK